MADRVQKLIALSGYCSRRNAEKLISQGLVKVNGKEITIGDKAEASDEISVEGNIIDINPKKIYLLLNKPEEYVCTAYDPAKRKTILELVKDVKTRLYTVGRLDYDASGAIFLTNDGDFAQKVSHPSFECPKTYKVILRRDLSENDIHRLSKGIVIDGRRVKSDIEVLVPNKAMVTIHVGIHKVIKRMFKSVDNYVRKLKRVSIGCVHIGKLKTGSYRELTKEEVEYFMNL